MELTQEQYAKVEKYLPKQRGNVKIDNLQFLYGSRHTIYMRMNRRSKNGVLDRVFAALQAEGIINSLRGFKKRGKFYSRRPASKHSMRETSAQ